jgi:lipid A disaccharide synthetase
VDIVLEPQPDSTSSCPASDSALASATKAAMEADLAQQPGVVAVKVSIVNCTVKVRAG